jgi:PAS domain S-box-containing protein
MTKDRPEPSYKAEIRRRAEERIKANEEAIGPSDPEADLQKFHQELQIHQIELEMQNEELIESRNETNALLAKFNDIYDFAPIGYFTLNPDGIIRQVNLTGASLLGVERARLKGQQLRFYVSDDFRPVFNKFFSKTFEGETIESCELKLQNGEHPSCFVQLEARLSEDAKECNLAMIDITDRRKAEALLDERTRQLENINRELESFSYSVSHDLRAPLRAIDGFSQMILKKEGDRFDEDTRDKFQVIRSGTQKMNQLIDDLLSFAHIARMEPSVSKLDMQGLFHVAWQELQRDNHDRVISLKINKLPECMGDRNLMLQVCTNILSNAVKFTKLRNVALIETGGYLKNNECVYFVKDNGTGFDMAYHDKLFGVFQRLHSDTEYEGTGIGLALVKRIVNRHGGRVWAEGKVDKGATFYFTLPTRKE